jgi:hypothetical protein
MKKNINKNINTFEELMKLANYSFTNTLNCIEERLLQHLKSEDR